MPFSAMILIIQSPTEIVYFIIIEKWQLSHIIPFPFEYGNVLPQG